MTKEEIKKNAEEYASKNYEIIIDNCNSFVTSEEFLKQGHIDGAESRQVEIDFACELIKELVKLYHVNMPYYDNIVVWKAEQFLKEQNK